MGHTDLVAAVVDAATGHVVLAAVHRATELIWLDLCRLTRKVDECRRVAFERRGENLGIHTGEPPFPWITGKEQAQRRYHTPCNHICQVYIASPCHN